MPPAFDPELYLRLAGERSLLEPLDEGRAPWESSVQEIAEALVGIGVLDITTAQDVVADYQLALSLRNRGHVHPGMFAGVQHSTRTRSAPLALSAARVVACDVDIVQSWGKVHVHYVALGDRSTAVAVTAVEAAGQIFPGPRFPAGNMQQIQLTDDRGTKEVAHFSGSGTMQGWQGHLTTLAPLARDTRWIDVGAERVELGEDDGDPPAVRMETLPPCSPAESYLRFRIAAAGHLPAAMGQSERTIETLIEAGMLAADDPVIADVRAVVAAFTGQTPSTPLPTPWSALLPRLHVTPAGPAPEGIVPIGAVTEPIDGVVVAMEALVAAGDGNWGVRVTTSPGVAQGMQAFLQAGGARIAWWAEDDRGNAYIGGAGSWGDSTSHSEGTINYWPPLDPRATELRLLPTGRTERAVLAFPLPWGTCP
jgi:hypothetical protein